MFPLDTLSAVSHSGWATTSSPATCVRAVYVLAQDDEPLQVGGGNHQHAVAVDGANRALTGQRVNLTMRSTHTTDRDSLPAMGRLWSGNHFGQVYSIQTPSGFVTVLGQLASFNHMYTESSVFFGVAER